MNGIQEAWKYQLFAVQQTAATYSLIPLQIKMDLQRHLQMTL